MNFTTNLPTQPGFYAWKRDEYDSIHAVTVYKDAVKMEFVLNGNLYHLGQGGLWCRLVPAEEYLPLEKAITEFVPKSMFMEELQKAHHEGWSDHSENSSYWDETWNNSRARRVAEGKE